MQAILCAVLTVIETSTAFERSLHYCIWYLGGSSHSVSDAVIGWVCVFCWVLGGAGGREGLLLAL